MALEQEIDAFLVSQGCQKIVSGNYSFEWRGMDFDSSGGYYRPWTLYEKLSNEHRMKGDVVIVPTEFVEQNDKFSLDIYECNSRVWPKPQLSFDGSSGRELAGAVRALMSLGIGMYIVPVDGECNIYTFKGAAEK